MGSQRLQRLGFSSSLAIGEALADWICDRPGRLDISALSPARLGVRTDEELVSRGVWQYAHAKVARFEQET